MLRTWFQAHDPLLAYRLLDRESVGRSNDHAKPHAKREQVTQRQRPDCRHGVIQWPVYPPQHAAVRQLRQQPVDGLIEPELALLNQDHCGHGRNRLGHRCDAEDRVAPDRIAPVPILAADGIHVRLAMPAEQRHNACHLAPLDMTCKDIVHAVEPRLRESTTDRHDFVSPRC